MNYRLIDELNKFKSSKLCTIEEQHMISHFLNFLENNPAGFDRANSGHITSSAWIVNHERTHALLTHHKKFDLWVQLGGHNDGNRDCKQVAAQEGWEESGIPGLEFLHEGIFDIDIHAIASKCAYHYDIRYLMQAPKGSNFIVSEESHDLAWVPFEKISEQTLFASVLRMNEKFKKYFR